MNIDNKAQKTEAIVRMGLLDIAKDAIEQFEKSGVILIGKHPSGHDDMIRIRQFETDNNALVYAVIRTTTMFGLMDSYLFVSKYQDEWENDRSDLASAEDGVLAYVYNHDNPDFSEFGMIGIRKTSCGDLTRIW